MSDSAIAPHPELLERLAALWDRGRAPTGLILAGPRGIGKATLARALAVRILGMRGEAGEAHPDLAMLCPDPERKAPTITVESARAACASLWLSSARGGARILVIDAGDDLTQQASSALLKTLEEPPADASILIIAHQPDRLLATIRSRCRTVRVSTPSRADAIRVARSIKPEISEAEASSLLELTGGSPGEALRISGLDAAGIYSDLIGIMAPAVKSGHMDRQAINDFADAHGGDGFPLTASLLLGFLHRAAETAAVGRAPPPAVRNETMVLEGFAAKAGIAGLSASWPIAERIAADTSEQFLDKRYAIVRLGLAIEHAMRSARQ